MIEIPKKCKAALLVEFGKPLEIHELDVPDKVEPNAILVRNEMAGICGSDVHLWRGRLGTVSPLLPIIPGHETIGRIAKLGEGRTHDCAGNPLHLGDRIMWSHVECGDCYWCKIADQSNLCSNITSWGFRCCGEYPYLCGGFAEYTYLVPKAEVVKIPEELSNDEVAAIPCAGRTALAAYETLGGYRLQDSVVIQGAGAIGLFSMIYAREGGAGRIIVVGAPEKKLALAQKWGADYTINIDEVPNAEERKQMILELTEGRGSDVVVEGSGGRTAFSEGLEMVRSGGRYLIVGQSDLQNTDTIVPAMIMMKHLTIIGNAGALISHYHTALQVVLNRRDKYNFADLITNKYSLEDVNGALTAMEAGKEIRPVLIP